MTRRTFVGHPSLMAWAAFALCAVLFPSVSRGFAVQGLQVRADGAGAYGSSVSAGNRLYYQRFRNRWYSPELGRFLSRDPVGFAGGPNLYTYVGNNPTSYRDPRGLLGQGLVTGGFGAVIGAAIGGWRGGWQGAWRGALSGGIGGFVAGETFGLVNPVAVGLLGEGVAAASSAGAASGAAAGFVGTAVDIALDPNGGGGPCAPVAREQNIGTRLAIGAAAGALLGGVVSGALAKMFPTPAPGSGGGEVIQPPDTVYRAPNPGPFAETPNPSAAQTVGEHVWGGEHLEGSPFESWTSDRSVAEEFARRRGTDVLELDLRNVDPAAIAADLRTPEGRAAAAALESQQHLKDVLEHNLDSEVILLRRR